jgi:hypothetical protein
MNSQTTKKVTLALGVASVAASMGNVAVKAGPALQTVNNMTNTAEFTINNTYGQSFSVNGIIGSSLQPFDGGSAAGSLVDFTASEATLETGFQGNAFGASFRAVSQVRVSVSVPSLLAPPVQLDSGNLSDINLIASGTQTLGASISSTLFGPSSVKATASFTNQLINDLSAF